MAGLLDPNTMDRPRETIGHSPAGITPWRAGCVDACAQQFLDLRLSQGFEGTKIKRFQVPTSYVDELRASVVPESRARQFPHSPFAVDVNQAPDQFGLRASLFDELLAHIIPGSGRYW
jgi:hypothetical protein